MRPMTGQDWCFSHHPDLADARHDARRRGGYQRALADKMADDPQLMTVEGAVKLLEKVTGQLMRGEILPRVAHAVFRGVRLALRRHGV